MGDDLDEWVMKLAGYFTLIDILIRLLKATKPQKRQTLQEKAQTQTETLNAKP